MISVLNLRRVLGEYSGVKTFTVRLADGSLIDIDPYADPEITDDRLIMREWKTGS